MRGHGGIPTWGLTAAVASGLLALLLLLALSPARAAASGGGIVSHELNPGDASSFFSTGFSRAQIRRAKPLPLPALDARAGRDATAGAAEPAGEPGYIEGTLPAGAAIGSATLQAGASARGFGKFTSNAVADPTVFPNTTNGKVIGKIKGVGRYSCSASVIHARNRNTIFTAGHCVKEPGGHFASKLAFAPAYSEGSAPLGAWKGSKVFVQNAWATQGNNNYDYAAVVMKASEGRKLEKVTGSKGFAYNIPVKKKTFRAVGYPFNKDHTNTMWECVSGFAGYDPGYHGAGPSPFGIGCDMSSGASGGGWTVPGEYLASVSSFTYDQIPNHLFGPRFSKAAERLRAAAGRFKGG